MLLGGELFAGEKEKKKNEVGKPGIDGGVPTFDI